MTTIITIDTERSTGADLASWGNLTARSPKSCAARKLARAMIAAGADPGPFEARGTDGRLRYTGRSLAAFARFTLSPDLRRAVWTPHPLYGGGEDAKGA